MGAACANKRRMKRLAPSAEFHAKGQGKICDSSDQKSEIGRDHRVGTPVFTWNGINSGAMPESKRKEVHIERVTRRFAPLQSGTAFLIVFPLCNSSVLSGRFPIPICYSASSRQLVSDCLPPVKVRVACARLVASPRASRSHSVGRTDHRVGLRCTGSEGNEASAGIGASGDESPLYPRAPHGAFREIGARTTGSGSDSHPTSSLASAPSLVSTIMLKMPLYRVPGPVRPPRGSSRLTCLVRSPSPFAVLPASA